MEWREKNKKHLKEYYKNWCRENPEKRKISQQKYEKKRKKKRKEDRKIRENNKYF